MSRFMFSTLLDIGASCRRLILVTCERGLDRAPDQATKFLAHCAVGDHRAARLAPHSEPDGTSDPMGSTGTSPALSMSTPNVLGAPDLPVRALEAARTAHTLSPNLSAERVGVQPSRVGHDPPCGFLTAGSILSRLDRQLPLGVSRGWKKDQRAPEDRLYHCPHLTPPSVL